MPSRDELIEDAIEQLDEYANTLQALAQTLDDSNPSAAYSARAIAQQLWELEKGFTDEREKR